MSNRSITVFGIKTCDTCRKALKLLGDAQFVDLRADGMPEARLQQAFDFFGEDLVNRRSTTWRGLSEEERSGDSLSLLRAHPTLMKRPLIVAGDEMHLGWGKDVQARLLG